MTILAEDEGSEGRAKAAEEGRDRLGVVAGEAAVEEEGTEVRELEEGWGEGGMSGVACREGSVVGEGAEGEGDDVVDVIAVGHALDSMPPAAAHVWDGGGPCVAGGRHDLVHGVLLSLVGPGNVGEAVLGAVDEGRRVR